MVIHVLIQTPIVTYKHTYTHGDTCVNTQTQIVTCKNTYTHGDTCVNTDNNSYIQTIIVNTHIHTYRYMC